MNIAKRIASSLALMGVAACSSSPVVLTPPTQGGGGTVTPTKYTQIERLSRPAIKEAFESFQDHQISNAAEPYNDPTIKADIATTEDAVRPANTAKGTDYGAALASVLYPDEYLVNLSGTAPASSAADPELFLSAEVDGGTAFGGRAPNDDVIALELGALFGKTLPAIGLIADDGEENNCLMTENIHSGADSGKNSTTTFPYLAAAR